MASRSQPCGAPESAATTAEPSAVWRCFHCDEAFTDRQEAQDHFGLDGVQTPACVEVLTAGEAAIVESRNYWRDRALREESDHERTGCELRALKWDAYRITKKYGGQGDSLWFAFEHVEGRMLAAEEALSAAPRWLAPWLRRRAEARHEKRRRWAQRVADAARSASPRAATGEAA